MIHIGAVSNNEDDGFMSMCRSAYERIGIERSVSVVGMKSFEPLYYSRAEAG